MNPTWQSLCFSQPHINHLAAVAFPQAYATLKLKAALLGVEGRRTRVLETHDFDEFAAGSSAMT